MLARVSGEWRYSNDMTARVSGSWVGNDKFVKIDGVWRQLLPENAITLYVDGSVATGGLICDGTLGTPNLLGRLARAHQTNILGHDGADTHDASAHSGGSGTLNTYNSGRRVDGYNLLAWATYVWNSTSYSHSHSVTAHQHPGTGPNFPPSLGVLPVIGETRYRAGAVVLTETAQALALLNALNLVNKCLYISSLVSEVGQSLFSELHDHDETTGVSNNSSAANALAATAGRSYTRCNIGHNHGLITHRAPMANHATVSDISFYGYATNAAMWLDELPAGAILILAGSRVPDGFEDYDTGETALIGNGVFIKASTGHANPVQRTESHYHSAVLQAGSFSQANTGTPNCAYRADLSSSTECASNYHTHTSFTDSHATAVTHTPLYVNFKLVRKTA